MVFIAASIRAFCSGVSVLVSKGGVPEVCDTIVASHRPSFTLSVCADAGCALAATRLHATATTPPKIARLLIIACSLCTMLWLLRGRRARARFRIHAGDLVALALDVLVDGVYFLARRLGLGDALPLRVERIDLTPDFGEQFVPSIGQFGDLVLEARSLGEVAHALLGFVESALYLVHETHDNLLFAVIVAFRPRGRKSTSA